VKRSSRYKQLHPLIIFYGIDAAVITFLLYWGHYVTPTLLLGTFPSILFGMIHYLPRELQYPIWGLLLCIIPPIVACFSQYSLSWVWAKKTARRTGASLTVLFFPVAIGYLFILPWEMTPIFMFLLLSGVMLILSFFTLHQEPLRSPDLSNENRRKWALEYIKHQHEDWKTLLNLSLGAAFSILITLLIGAVSFFYGEVLRFGLTDPRGLFPYWQTITVVIIAGLIMLQIAYGLSYRFYQRMTECTNRIYGYSSKFQ